MQDNVQMALNTVVAYDWDEEKSDFQEEFGVEISEDDLDHWVKVAHDTPEMKGHIFYSLMVLKQHLEDLNYGRQIIRTAVQNV